MLISFTFHHILNKHTPAYDRDVSVFIQTHHAGLNADSVSACYTPGSRMNLLGLL